MDVFVFPSRYEGLGIAAVEAQFCGVRTVMSDKVPYDAAISANTQIMSLNNSVEEWVECVLEEKASGEITHCVCSEYDITKASIKLINYYEDVIREKRNEYTG